MNTEAASFTVDRVNALISRGDWLGIERLLAADIDDSFLPVLALARATYPVRRRLSNWSDYIKRAKRHFGPSKVFRGLNDFERKAKP